MSIVHRTLLFPPIKKQQNLINKHNTRVNVVYITCSKCESLTMRLPSSWYLSWVFHMVSYIKMTCKTSGERERWRECIKTIAFPPSCGITQYTGPTSFPHWWFVVCCMSEQISEFPPRGMWAGALNQGQDHSPGLIEQSVSFQLWEHKLLWEAHYDPQFTHW